MPSIIEAPTRTRRDSRGMSEAEATEYVEALSQVETGQVVQVDDSETDGYEKSYAKGERVRTALKKFNLIPEGEAVQVIAFQLEDDGKFVSALRYKA